ncbi:MAG: transglutaminase family protein [Aeromicrobium erythreum]
MRYRVSHRTRYTYDADVTDSLGVAYVVPRELPWQRVSDAVVEVDPGPSDVSRSLDHYGNHVTYFQVTEPHRRLDVVGRSVVDVEAPVVEGAALQQPWESLRPLVHPELDDAWHVTDLALESPLVEHVDAAHAYAEPSLRPGRPVGEAVLDLVHRVHADVAYEPGATTVTSTIADVLRDRAGVCQDFAQLMLACLRSHGLAARYVSGYLATDPPPGMPRLVGADASHAWVSVWLGGGTWLAVDPTNDQVVDDRYVTVAWGRDYGDVPPLKGVILTDATSSSLDVEVDVAPEPA